MVKILIADDHPVVRQGLKQVLADEADMKVEGEAANANELLAKVRRESWDIVLLDITMPGRGGLEVLKDLRRERAKLPVLVLSMHPEDQFGLRVLKAGAAGYLTKDSAPEELVKAIRKVCGGGKYISPLLAEQLAVRLDPDEPRPPHEFLSDREYQVMCLIASGKRVGDIAKNLSLSVKTISTYRLRILEKMGVKTNAELTRYAIERALI
ncbi:MAG TPA: response regulator transcription factor [Candidatus Binatia bacterium]|jgi:DNA-binding NarL/FixJ family response regulator